MSDEGFHEIQLNGKQLVFLFMAVTVVSVVIFLCGVLVGRSVRGFGGGTSEVAALGSDATPSITPDAGAAAPPPAAAPAPAATETMSAVPPPPVNDELSYYSRLEDQGQPAEELKPAAPRGAAEKPVDKPAGNPAPAPPPAAKAAEKPAVRPAEPVKPAAPAPVPAAAPAAAGSDLPGEPAGAGFAVQIAALRERGEAQAIVKRLAGKGYSAYVLPPAPGTPAVYRVRVGKFASRQEAQQAATRLEKEEQFKPWVVR